MLIVSLWTLLILGRPLASWKLALVATMVGAAALIVAVPPVATNVFLLHPTPPRVLIATAIGVVGAILVEISHQAGALTARRARDSS